MVSRILKMTAALVFCIFILTGCSGKKDELVEEAGTVEDEAEALEDTAGEEEAAQVYLVYYLNEDGTTTTTLEYEPEGGTAEELVEELIEQMSSVTEDSLIYPVLGTDAVLLGYSLENAQLTLDFESGYSEMTKQKEILIRSAVVRTLCQIPDVESVSFTVAGEALLDSKSTPIGTMTADSFVENTGDDINVYTTTTLDLYYANETGDMLVEELVELRYSSNMSIEKLVLEQLIRGPISDDAYPTIPSTTNILSVSTKDGVCYVNLDDGFLDYGYDLIEELPIYSIVNSLTEISGINQVQILINGETDLIFRESISFDMIFERNLDLVETLEE